MAPGGSGYHPIVEYIYWLEAIERGIIKIEGQFKFRFESNLIDPKNTRRE